MAGREAWLGVGPAPPPALILSPIQQDYRIISLQIHCRPQLFTGERTTPGPGRDPAPEASPCWPVPGPANAKPRPFGPGPGFILWWRGRGLKVIHLRRRLLPFRGQPNHLLGDLFDLAVVASMVHQQRPYSQVDRIRAGAKYAGVNAQSRQRLGPDQ